MIERKDQRIVNAHVVYGPPGTGKSTELIRRMRRYIDNGVPEHQIGFVSFTKAAAIELAHRVGVKPGGNISTIHSMAFRLSGIIKDQVVDRHKLNEFSKISGIEIAGANPDEADYLSDGDAYLALYQLYHAKAVNHQTFTYEHMYMHSNRPGELNQFIRFCEGMDKFKSTNGYVDFNDMLKRALKEPGPDIDILFVDEAQDLSPLQWQLIYYWCKFLEEIHVAGDDDQSIYVWGGADPSGMPKFERKFKAERTILNQSYRVPFKIHKLGQKIITNVKDRVSKEYNPTKNEGELNNFIDPYSPIGDVEHGKDVLILFRNHFLRKEIEDRLVQLGIPYVVDSGKPGLLHSFQAKAIKSWNILIRDWKQTGHIMLQRREYNNLLRNVKYKIKIMIEKEEIDSIIDYKWDSIIDAPYQTLFYFRKIFEQYQSLDIDPTIHLSTIHGSKGREAEHVILINGMSNRSVDSMLRDPDSEYRTFYVGVTRAKQRLDIIPSENPLGEL